MELSTTQKAVHSELWNKVKLVGQTAPLKLREIWAIRVRLQLASRFRELALFNLAIDSKLRACDLVQLKVRDVCYGSALASRTSVMQQKTHRPVQFEITEAARECLGTWIKQSSLRSEDFLFPSRIHESPHLSTRNTPELLRGGFGPSVLSARTMGRTRCAEPRRH